MKFNTKFLISAALFLTCNINYVYSDDANSSTSENEKNGSKEITIQELEQDINKETEQENTAEINSILNKQLEQLSKIIGKIQILGQMVNKNSISFAYQEFEIKGKICETKLLVKNWLKKKQQKINEKIKQIANPAKNIDEELIKLQYLVIFIEKHTNKIIKKLKNRFEFDKKEIEKLIKTLQEGKKNSTNNDKKEKLNPKINEQPIPITTRAAKIRQISENVGANDELIEILELQTRDAGLTNLNKFVRKIDQINNEYGITKYLNFAPLAVTSALIATYLTPDEHVKKIPLLNRLLIPLKNYIGSTSILEDLRAKQNKKNNSRQNNDGKLAYWLKSADFLSGNSEVRSLCWLLALSAAPIVFKSGIIETIYPKSKEITDRIRTKFNNWFNKLKGINSFKKSTYNYDSPITLDDERLVGLEEQVSELKKIVQYIVDPEIYDKANCNLEKGILLTGPSRNGKTFAANALQGTLNKLMEEKGKNIRFAFKEIKWSDVSWSEDGIKAEIEEAKEHAPCILFIDEIHNIPLQTKDHGGKILTGFLTGMSGINSENDLNHQVILLAATNHPEFLDDALRKPGRFGKIIHFTKPNLVQRKKYFEVQFENNSIDLKGTDIDIDSLARRTHNCSYGDLESITKAARFTARSLAKNINQKMLEDQIDAQIYRLKNNSDLSEIEKKYLAAHNAGHALMYLLLEPIEQLEFVTIKGRWCKIREQRWFEKKEKLANETTKYGMILTNESSIKTDDEKMKLAKIKLAGGIAEKILYGSTGISSVFKDKTKIGHQKDKQKALSYIKSIVYNELDEAEMPKQILKEKSLKAHEILEQCEKETTELLTKNKALLEKITKELENKETLTATEIKSEIEKISKDTKVE